MPFSTDAWAANAGANSAILTMPFNNELAAGTLPRETFKGYIVQDAHYLLGFSRALSLAAAKAPTALHKPTTAARLSAGKADRIKVRDAGVSMAPPAAWTTRAATRLSELGASPHARLAKPKTAIPHRNTRRAPILSASRPKGISNAAYTIV